MTPDLNEPAEREAFEKMQIAGGCTANDLVRDPATNAYDLWDVSMEWNGWLARARIAAQREAELVKDAERWRYIRELFEHDVTYSGRPCFFINAKWCGEDKTPTTIEALIDAALAPEAGR